MNRPLFCPELKVLPVFASGSDCCVKKEWHSSSRKSESSKHNGIINLNTEFSLFS